MRWMAAWIAGVGLGCGEPCPTGSFEESNYCVGGCPELADLSEGCIGSHTQQICRLGSREVIVTGGNDAVRMYFDPEAGTMLAVQQLDPPQREVAEVASCEASEWFGEDLTGCTLQGEPETVPCDGLDE